MGNFLSIRKFLSLNFVDFVDSWWSSFINFNVWMTLHLWSSKLTKKSKFDFCVTIDFSSVDLNSSTINHLHLGNVLSHVIRSKWCNWNLEIMPWTNWAFARSKIRNCPFSIETLILTILPFWWFDQISWGIVIQTWSHDSYKFKMLIWIKNYEVWL